MEAVRSLCSRVVVNIIVRISRLSGDVMNMEEEIVRVLSSVVKLPLDKERVYDVVLEASVSSI